MALPAVLAPSDTRCTGETLALERVTRHHAGRAVWASVDLRLEAGTLCVVTGANGSGKTTLLRLAAGLLRPTTGTRRCSGSALYVRAGAGLRSAQTVSQAVAGTAALVGRQDAAQTAVARLGLDPLAHRRIGTLSAGERVRVTLATALAARPALLCLDEPTGALDEGGLRVLLRVLDDVRGAGCATLVATHQPAALLPVADAHLHLCDGRLVAA
ncbi:MAG: ATP-binding cassette domain-containing protein [Mycobacteriales bacterium]